MAKRDLGKMGEHKVLHWLNEVGIIANKVSDDKGGWDIFIQYQSKTDSNKFAGFDIKPTMLSCVIQVKATDKSEGKIKGIKLSNWKRLVESPLPAFFVVLEYRGQNEVQKAYTVHVGKELIAKTLERIYKLNEDELDNLHKKTMTLRYTNDDLLKVANGEHLKNSIFGYIKEDTFAYFKKKVEWFENVGYEEFPIKGKVTLPSMPYEDLMNVLVDFSIGVMDELRIDSLYAEKVRFGIPIPLTQDHPLRKGVMKIENLLPTGKAEIQIVNAKNNDLLLKELFSYYSPGSIFPFIPFECWKMRFSSDWCTIISYPKNQKINLKIKLFESDKRNSLHQMTKAVRFIRQGILKEEVQMDMYVIQDGKSFEVGSLGTPDFPPINLDIKKILLTIENAWIVFRKFEPFDDIKISLNELIQQENILFLMKSLINNDIFKGATYIIEDEKQIISDLTTVAFMFGISVIFGEDVFFMTGCLVGAGKVRNQDSEKMIEIENGQGRCIKTWRIPKTRIRKFSIKMALDESYNLLLKEGIKTVFEFEKIGFKITKSIDSIIKSE